MPLCLQDLPHRTGPLLAAWRTVAANRFATCQSRFAAHCVQGVKQREGRLEEQYKAEQAKLGRVGAALHTSCK